MLNKVQLIGNLGQEPEVRYINSGTAICGFSVATTRKWTDKQEGTKEETEWHSVEVWGKHGEACGQYLHKGSKVYVEGRIKTEKWQDKTSGQDKYRTKIVAENVIFLNTKQQSATAEAAPTEAPVNTDDIPF